MITKVNQFNIGFKGWHIYEKIDASTVIKEATDFETSKLAWNRIFEDMEFKNEKGFAIPFKLPFGDGTPTEEILSAFNAKNIKA